MYLKHTHIDDCNFYAVIYNLKAVFYSLEFSLLNLENYMLYTINVTVLKNKYLTIIFEQSNRFICAAVSSVSYLWRLKEVMCVTVPPYKYPNHHKVSDVITERVS